MASKSWQNIVGITISWKWMGIYRHSSNWRTYLKTVAAEIVTPHKKQRMRGILPLKFKYYNFSLWHKQRERKTSLCNLNNLRKANVCVSKGLQNIQGLSRNKVCPNKCAVKVHDVTRPALIVKRLGLAEVPNCKIELKCLENQITLIILGSMGCIFAAQPTTWLSQLKTNVKVRQSL